MHSLHMHSSSEEGEETSSILNRTVNTKQSHVFLRHMRTKQVCRRSLLLVWHVGCEKTHILTCSRIHKTFWHPTHTCATQLAASGATLSAVSHECDMSHINVAWRPYTNESCHTCEWVMSRDTARCKRDNFIRRFVECEKTHRTKQVAVLAASCIVGSIKS